MVSHKFSSNIWKFSQWFERLSQWMLAYWAGEESWIPFQFKGLGWWGKLVSKSIFWNSGIIPSTLDLSTSKPSVRNWVGKCCGSGLHYPSERNQKFWGSRDLLDSVIHTLLKAWKSTSHKVYLSHSVTLESVFLLVLNKEIPTKFSVDKFHLLSSLVWICVWPWVPSRVKSWP